MFKPAIPTVQVAGDASPSLAPATLRLPSPPYSQLAVADDSPSQRFTFTTIQTESRRFSLPASSQLPIVTIQTPVTPNRDESDAGDARLRRFRRRWHQIATLQTPVTPDRNASASNRRRRFSFQSPAMLHPSRRFRRRFIRWVFFFFPFELIFFVNFCF